MEITGNGTCGRYRGIEIGRRGVKACDAVHERADGDVTRGRTKRIGMGRIGGRSLGLYLYMEDWT
jgi:hypothetical protein